MKKNEHKPEIDLNFSINLK